MEPQPCHAKAAEDGTGGSVLLWETGKGSHVRVWVDPDVPLQVLNKAVWVIRCAESTLPVAHIRWNAVPDRGCLSLLYNTLEAHGIPIHPDHAAALRGWDDHRGQTEEGGGRTPLALSVRQETTTSVRPELALTVTGQNEGHHQPGVWRVESLEELTRFADGEPLFTHLWVVATRCRFPLERLRAGHAALGMDLCERVSRLSPEPLVRAYHWDGVTVPLLMWYRDQEPRVVSLIREYLHIMYPHIPAVRVWHFCLLPEGAALNLIARRFRDAHIWPSWYEMWRLVLPSTSHCHPEVSLERLEATAGRTTYDPDRRHMFTTHDGLSVMWFGLDVFFYVQGPPSADAADVTLPQTHRDLPTWVPELLAEECGPTVVDVRANLDDYFTHFANIPVSEAVQALRRINWPALPLQWQPTRMRGLPWRVSRRESAAAQERLLGNVIPNAEVRADAQSLLARITGLSTA